MSPELYWVETLYGIGHKPRVLLHYFSGPRVLRQSYHVTLSLEDCQYITYIHIRSCPTGTITNDQGNLEGAW